MLLWVEAANATKVQKKAFPKVSACTICRCLKEQGLLCHVQRSKPYISPANKEKRRLWAMQHARWTVEDWRRVIFLNKSKFMLFKSDGHQYCWIKPGQALDAHFTKKNIKHEASVQGCWGMVPEEKCQMLAMATIKSGYEYYWACLGPIGHPCMCLQPIAMQQGGVMGCSSGGMGQFSIGSIGQAFWKHAISCSCIIEGLRWPYQVLTFNLWYPHLLSHISLAFPSPT